MRRRAAAFRASSTTLHGTRPRRCCSDLASEATTSSACNCDRQSDLCADMQSLLGRRNALHCCHRCSATMTYIPSDWQRMTAPLRCAVLEAHKRWQSARAKSLGLHGTTYALRSGVIRITHRACTCAPVELRSESSRTFTGSRNSTSRSTPAMGSRAWSDSPFIRFVHTAHRLRLTATKQARIGEPGEYRPDDW